MGALSGVFNNYLNGPHALSVEALHEHPTHHFGANQVFLDKASGCGGGARLRHCFAARCD